MNRQPKPKLPPLEHFLQFHKDSCTVHIYSGDRHCSCGRDEAIKELRQLRTTPKQMEFAK